MWARGSALWWTQDAVNLIGKVSADVPTDRRTERVFLARLEQGLVSAAVRLPVGSDSASMAFEQSSEREEGDCDRGDWQPVVYGMEASFLLTPPSHWEGRVTVSWLVCICVTSSCVHCDHLHGLHQRSKVTSVQG